MEFKKPKPKKNSNEKPAPSFKNEKDIIGVFNGQFVSVYDLDSMLYLYQMGNFGKGSLSKAEPNHHLRKDDIPKIILKHEFENQAKWNNKKNDFHSYNLSTSTRNDYKLSMESVFNFFTSTFNEDGHSSWESLNDDRKFKTSKREVSFLESKTDESVEKDENFYNIVSEILESKQMKKNKISNTSSEVIVLDPSVDGSFSPHLEKLSFPPEETLNLNLEESFYLKTVLKCLRILDLNSIEVEINDLWEKFNSIDKMFTEKYITYRYYRLKNWIVRSGLKFGGDYLLYKDGPDHYHGSYLVKILDGRKKVTWREFVGMNRLVETFNKDLLLVNVVQSEKSDKESIEDFIGNCSVQEVLVRRWLPSKDRLMKNPNCKSN